MMFVVWLSDTVNIQPSGLPVNANSVTRPAMRAKYKGINLMVMKGSGYSFTN